MQDKSLTRLVEEAKVASQSDAVLRSPLIRVDRHRQSSRGPHYYDIPAAEKDGSDALHDVAHKKNWSTSRMSTKYIQYAAPLPNLSNSSIHGPNNYTQPRIENGGTHYYGNAPFHHLPAPFSAIINLPVVDGDFRGSVEDNFGQQNNQRFESQTTAYSTNTSRHHVDHSAVDHYVAGAESKGYKSTQYSSPYNAQWEVSSGGGSHINGGYGTDASMTQVQSRENQSQGVQQTHWQGLVQNIHVLPFNPARKLLQKQASHAFSEPIEQSGGGLLLHQPYLGDVDQLNEILPADENTSLYLRGIPAHATLKEHYSQFIEGAVFAYTVDPPIPGFYTTCAARLAFTTREAAEAFYDRANRTYRGVRIGGQKINVQWSDHKTRPLCPEEGHQTRVVQVKGTSELSPANLLDFFHTNIDFELVHLDEWLVDGGHGKVVEIHFQSILGQSRAAMKCFYKWVALAEDRDDYRITYGPDPCNPMCHHFQGTIYGYKT